MRIMVTGSRNWTDRERVKDALFDAQATAKDATLIHGACPVREKCPTCKGTGVVVRGHPADPGEYACLSCHGTGKVGGGADWIADEIARGWGWEVETYPPVDNWAHGGRQELRPGDNRFAAACRARNQEMAESKPDICLAFPMPGSKGTWHAIRCAADALVPEIWIYAAGREG